MTAEIANCYLMFILPSSVGVLSNTRISSSDFWQCLPETQVKGITARSPLVYTVANKIHISNSEKPLVNQFRRKHVFFVSAIFSIRDSKYFNLSTLFVMRVIKQINQSNMLRGKGQMKCKIT